MKTETRRTFLKQAGSLGVCACCIGASSFLSSCAASKRTTSAVPFTETAETVTIPVAVFNDKNSVTIKTKKFEDPVFIGKNPDGSYLSLLMHCPHKGCTVNVTPDKFVCPCHGSQFALDGALLKGPAKSALQSLTTTVVGQNVMVQLT